jgi:PPK2 family polyphosphate:nucleotide phosphotransferase
MEKMMDPIDSPYIVPSDGCFSVKDAPTIPPSGAPGKKECKSRLKDIVREISELQRVMYAHDQHSLLLVFQAMDAAGKDGTIRKLLSGVNPAGCQVHSFKAPSKEELDHDFLWRTSVRLPERGRIGVFNRSYYEEVLVVRVHPQFLGGQKLPKQLPLETLWSERFESIVDWEKHLARNGTSIMKFWLNVSQREQHQRFRRRIDESRSNWKFNAGDLKESALWEPYMEAYQATLNATSTPAAPWYAIPADDKPYMRMTVAELVRDRLRSMNLSYPDLGEEDRRRLAEYRAQLLP